MKSRIFLVAAFVAICIVSIALVNRYMARSFFATSLAAANTYAEVVYKDRLYVVVNGAVSTEGSAVSSYDVLPVLRLAYKKITAQRSPLFALAGEPLDDLYAALKSLEEQRKIFADGQQDQISSGHIETSLYPLQFLNAAAALEEARRQFITTSSIASAKLYEKRLRLTADTFQADLLRHKDAYTSLIRSDMPAYGMLGSIVNRGSMEHALEALNGRISSVEIKLLRRALCTSPLTFFCDIHDLDLPLMREPDDMARSDDHLSSEVVSMYVEAGVAVDPSLIVHLSSSRCIPPDKVADFSFSRMSFYNDTYAFPIYVGDIVYVRSARYTESPFYAYFARRGVERVLVVPTTYYECSEALHDFASVLSVRSIRDFARTNDVSELIASSDDVKISPLREELMKRHVREADAIAYLNLLIQSLPQNASTAAMRSDIQNIAISYSGHTRGLTELLLAMTNEERGNRNLAKRGTVFDTGALNLFYTRSAFGSLFSIANTSPLISGDRLFSVNNLRKSSQPYEYFSSYRENDTLRADLVSDLHDFIFSHVSP